jgi:hypothetical protein
MRRSRLLAQHGASSLSHWRLLLLAPSLTPPPSSLAPRMTCSASCGLSFGPWQRICPPQHPSAMVRRGAVTVGPAVNELGVYGIFLSDGKEVLHNEAAGHLLRTKVRSLHGCVLA